jgi:hypothetical protein
VGDANDGVREEDDDDDEEDDGAVGRGDLIVDAAAGGDLIWLLLTGRWRSEDAC